MTATAPPVKLILMAWLPSAAGSAFAARAVAEFGQRQIRHDAGSLGAGIDDGLVGAGKNVLHRIEIHALAGHVGRLLVLLVDLQEARGLALGVGHDLGAIGLGILSDLRGAAPRFRDHAIGVGLRLVLHALEIGPGGLDVAEGVDHLRRVVGLLQLHLLYLNTGVVGVERLLHQLLHLGLNGVPAAGDDRLDIVAANDLAHCAFRHCLHGAFGILNIEKIVADVRLG